MPLIPRLITISLLLVFALGGQDKPKELLRVNDQLSFHVELGMRYENRVAVSFRPGADRDYVLWRSRLAADYKPAPWIKFHGMAQDARAPLYGPGAPSSVRDTLDLQEGYVEFMPDREEGFGLLIGREMATFGEARLIGAPQWLNVARTWDSVRLYHRTATRRLEVMSLSVVKVQPDSANTPNFGDRIWGTYNTFSDWIPEGEVELYALRHDQNRHGGFPGTGRAGVNLFGGRFAGPLPVGLRYSIEAVGQTGHVGERTHRAGGWYSGLTRDFHFHVPVQAHAEYKFASGTKDPAGDREGTFDQLYPANHDKFGRADLFGWKNIHNFRSQLDFTVAKGLVLTTMYNNSWLDSSRDGLYAGNGSVIAVAPNGDAGTHIGQELDLYVSYKRKAYQAGVGVAKFFAGEFVKNTTPAANSFFFFFYQGYTF